MCHINKALMDFLQIPVPMQVAEMGSVHLTFGLASETRFTQGEDARVTDKGERCLRSQRLVAIDVDCG
jgi:hypothetical protein